MIKKEKETMILDPIIQISSIINSLALFILILEVWCGEERGSNVEMSKILYFLLFTVYTVLNTAFSPHLILYYKLCFTSLKLLKTSF